MNEVNKWNFFCYWRYNGFSLSRDLGRLHGHMGTKLYGHVTLWARAHEVSYDPAKFGGSRHSDSRDVTL